MKVAIVHLSDIHSRVNWEENHGAVFKAFFDDLKKQIPLINANEVYLFISGDIVQAGDHKNEFEWFIDRFDKELNSIGVDKSHRICVPGNHDLSRKVVQDDIETHEAIISQKMDEIRFNDYAEKNEGSIFVSKFDNYKEFESSFTNFPSVNRVPTGFGWSLSDEIGVYCINSSYFSSGGLTGRDGKFLEDKGRLSVNTRHLHSWLRQCECRCKILVMHHPLDWLIDWANKELKTLLEKEFDMFMYGHAHDQTFYHSIKNDKELIEVSAPPLFTNKEGELGYSIITISHEGINDIIYRQWTKHQTFVAGVNFSNTDSGIVKIKSEDNCGSDSNRVEIESILSHQLDKALKSFSSQPIVWVDPVLANCSELDAINHGDSLKKFNSSDIINNTKSLIIKAPPQFGLTSLARHLALKSWQENKSLWLVVDANHLKPSEKQIKRTIEEELSILGKKIEDVDCIVVDSWSCKEKNNAHILKTLCSSFHDVPIVVMQTIEDQRIISDIDKDFVGREFDTFYLWTLTREDVRKVVSKYNSERHVGDEDKVLSKVVADIEVLNIHRTPLNCLTVLKASEVDFDDSPVNRTEMLRRVLFLIFNVDNIPSYKTKPDMKDCEFVLGYFCEKLLRDGIREFSRNEFISELEKYSKEHIIDLDIHVVFDVLCSNHILTRHGDKFFFKFAYWFYYFIAQRMHHNDAFTHFIYESKKYVVFPEVMEFYTGIDRKREDAVNILINDLKIRSKSLNEKLGIPDVINPYKFIQWKPSKEAIEQMQNDVSDGVMSSKLPDSIKDQYADKSYDKTKPYTQDIRDILSGNSLHSLMLSVRSASRALRNSDYVNPELKRELLDEILIGWKELSKVLLVLVPLLAERGRASFDDIAFLLAGDFGEGKEERFRRILMQIPMNVSGWYGDDIYSQKMAPLLFERIETETDDLKKHELIILLIMHRPRGWESVLEKYIFNKHKNSFYLYDVAVLLNYEYEYGFCSNKDLVDMGRLIKQTAAKHSFGTSRPGKKVLGKISDDVLPKRDDSR